MAQSPHVGSFKLYYLGSPFFYPELAPIYPHDRLLGGWWYKPSKTNGDYDFENANAELSGLNGFRADSVKNFGKFPWQVPLKLLYSRDLPTSYYGTHVMLPLSYFYWRGYCSGDSIVPGFSQLGLILNPNREDDPNNYAMLSRVPTLSGSSIQAVECVGQHSGFLEEGLWRDTGSPGEPLVPISDYFIKQLAIFTN